MHHSLYNQLLKDAQQQVVLEQKLAEHITRCKNVNENTFSFYCPNILPLLQQPEQKRFSLFCNLNGKANIVDRQNSSAVYLANPELEAETEVTAFISNAPVISFTPPVSNANWPTEPLPLQPDAICMFGLGLGHQILPLITRRKIRCLIIYEPDLTMLQCSFQTINWHDIFTAAASSNTLISLQMGNDGSSIASDLQELFQFIPALKKLYLYRHLSYSVTDEVLATLFTFNGNRAELLKADRQYLGYTQPTDYLPVRFNNILGNKKVTITDSQRQEALFQQNIAVFKRLYPDIAKSMLGFATRHWFLVKDDHGKANLWHKERNALLHSDKDTEATALIDSFLHQPPKDDVILGQKVAWKFRHYIHYQAIAKLQPLFLEMAQQKNVLPEKIDSLIIFGVGVGAYLPALLQQRNITNLYVCESNIEHFYASLFVTDWASLLQQAEQTGSRIYLNIGNDGSDYFNDLMQQFFSVGAFTIANTYMLQTDTNPFTASAIKKLRQQLKVVLTIGDYYDHARFGISHTYNSFMLGHNWLKAKRSNYLQHAATVLPVFIVGNGPSLDQCADYIKEHREKVVVVSCGTALKPLHHLGITPDFHAEVEQNRSTYRWITQVNDIAYLKKIKLITVNGIHPETAALFAGTYLAFKEGEASTTLFNKVLKGAGDIAQLSHAYPTVSNLAINWLLQAGFKQYYLLGVDLGYVDVNNHHSRFSAYYDQNGKAVYDYSAVHGDSISVVGNFRPVVQTKIEFDISRQIIEQTLTAYSGQAEVYNCSDGAMIQGAISLQPSQILTFLPSKPVTDLLDDFLQQACIQQDFTVQLSEFKRYYNAGGLTNSLIIWDELLTKPVTDYTSAKNCIDRQWVLLKQQASLPNSIIFYLLYGSASYFLSLLSKLLPLLQQAGAEAQVKAVEQFNTVLIVWKDYLTQMVADFAAEPLQLDITD
ncbi:hypothetical protein VT06_13070 [Arsukibacterium sp. MJ3]|uniref:motility associated factor glycosyltransferase family protein n=1 Tax=Arsukibacterium sp. MJ3 TaxID=1632859 RepID=UPI00062726CA|nr:6-hydroxymethylpterin diphosphokinase MptE-like protein [Arsukibacterium sp. MJ3]KKO48169.1 hypothetical protein VT06_13070 [Arsukibacterium sp. MJ3]